VIKEIYNSVTGLKHLQHLELPQYKNFMKRSILKLEKHQNSPKKLLNKTLLEIKRSSREQDLLELKKEKMSKREYKSDLNNLKNNKRRTDLVII
jgi:hypothetical protein